MSVAVGPAIPVSTRAAQAVVALLLILKLYLSLAMPPVGDEAYYWMWGQKLAWSYLDHPPLHAWLLGLMSHLFGWNLVGLRSLTWVTLGGTFAILWWWAKRLNPENPGAWFWPSAMVYLCSPLFFVMTTLAFHDHLLIFLCLAAGTAFLVFAEKWEATSRGYVWLYLGAILLGLAVLTKYNGVLVGIAVAIFFAVRKPMRPLWRSPHLYLAALLAIAIQAPVFWWNLTEGFASYRFHLSERWGGNLFELHPFNVVRFVFTATPYLSPLLFPAIARMIVRPLGAPFADRARALALAAFAVSCSVVLVLSFFIDIFFYWNITAFLLLMPLLVGWMNRRWMFVTHALYGSALILVAVFNFTIAPVGDLIGYYDWTVSSIYGWPQVAERVTALEQEHPVGFIATSRYTTAAQLGFALHDTEVTALAPRHDQYDYWFDPAAHDGEDALVVSDATLGLAGVTPYFDSLTPLDTVSYTVFGKTIFAPTIYLGRHFHAGAGK